MDEMSLESAGATEQVNVHAIEGTYGVQKKHALVIPLCFQAHIAGILRLALQLARRGVTISFVARVEELPRIQVHQELKQLDFHFLQYESLGHPRIAGWKDMADLLKRYREHFQPILRELKEGGHSSPTCIIYDRFVPWIDEVREELHLPIYTFYSCGATLTRCHQESTRLFPSIHEDVPLPEFEGPVTIPGLPPLLFHDLPRSLLDCVGAFKRVGQALGSADAVIANTFHELEAPQIDEIQRQFVQDPKNRTRFFPVGPLSYAATFKDLEFTQSEGNPDHGPDPLQWLDRRAPQSVLYICLGSAVHWTTSHITELACALEATGVDFLWVLRAGRHLSSPKEALPEGFRERTGPKGLVVAGWVPQLRILHHPSIGAFLSHCGWNSCIEAVTAGVPMIGWAQFAEQSTNCRHFEVELEVAVQVGRGRPCASTISRQELAGAIGRVMVDGAMRERIVTLKRIAAEAVAEGGASYRALEELTELIS